MNSVDTSAQNSLLSHFGVKDVMDFAALPFLHLMEFYILGIRHLLLGHLAIVIE